MKIKYNNIVEWIIIIILAVPFIALLALKYALKIIAKLVKAAQAVVKCSINYIMTLDETLIEVLSVKD